MMTIYTIRHGETEWNHLFRVQGRSDIPLNETGRAEAKRAGEAIEDIPLAAIFASPLIRAMQTAEIIRGDRDIPIYTVPGLMEMGFGVYEGKSRKYPEYGLMSDEFKSMFFDHPDRYIPPQGGESFAHVCMRGTQVLQMLASREKEFEGKNILVSAHGAIIRGFLSSLTMNGDLANFWDVGIPQNCSMCKLLVEDGKITLLEKDMNPAGIAPKAERD